ncbi:hypothetical protein M409DRAFT_70296 [Zasmidium cellare ATCC 36951]|uniref:Enoyl reductase (ER) domain-containing protein n=1 Tax=Zasmidium cellare ATCC 36951 TaxID=1080233 RepID=A0A6A6C2L8_ZASCE|nr:uncharacterized protein M409DRAFT_70296 [Zasmidium cellare ATCC 36951]KAF2160528.1 hypothetical protein M409DRAFT_70296 [Zasmidium cellare ATCC 36951]
MAPSTMKAIKIVEGHKAELQDVPLPKLRDDYVLCKVKCVALNPTDWKHIARGLGKPGCSVGVDFSGVIEEIGPKVMKEWKKGDRVCGFVHGGNQTQREDGTFGEYCLMKGDLGLKIPDAMSDEDAATLGTGVITCGQSMYQSLGLPEPGDGMEKYHGFFLVYGGSTATGTLAIQYAVLSGCRVLATASPHNHALLKALGAEQVFDYRDPSCGQKIRDYTNDTLTLALDCIAENDSPKICCDAISSAGGKIGYLLKTDHPRKDDVENKFTLGYTVIGEAFEKSGRRFEAKGEDFEYARRFWELTQKLVNAGQIAVHPPKVGADGLVGVLDGLSQLMEGRVSGVKLVYRVEETPTDRKA